MPFSNCELIQFSTDVAQLLPDGPDPVHHPDLIEHQNVAETEANGRRTKVQ